MLKKITKCVFEYWRELLELMQPLKVSERTKYKHVKAGV